MRLEGKSSAKNITVFENWVRQLKFRTDMTLSDRLRKDLTDAMREKDTNRVSTLRMFFTALKNKEIEEKRKDEGFTDDEVLAVLQKEAKKRRDAIREFEAAGRGDLAEQEKVELQILEKYLPAELSDEEIKLIIRSAVDTVGGGKEKFSDVMKHIMPELKNKASGDRITKLVKEML